MLAVLKLGNMELTASEEKAYHFTISISTGEIKFDEIVQWLKTNSEPFKTQL